MKTEMTAKDKKLLIFLIIFVIVVGFGYWGVRPLLNANKKLDSQIADAKEEKEVADYKLSMIPVLEKDNSMLAEELSASRTNYFPMMSSDQIDKMITGMMLDYGLYCYDLLLAVETDTASLAPYNYSIKALEADAADRRGSDSDSVDTKIRAVKVNVRVGGDDANLQKLIDDLSVTDKKLLLESYSWDRVNEVQSHADGTYEIIDIKTLSISMSFYMIADEE